MATPMQIRLAREIVVGKAKSTYQAMKKAGYNEATALANGKRTVESAGVRNEIARLEKGARDNARDILARSLTTIGNEVETDIGVALAAAKILPGVIEKIGEDGALPTARDRRDIRRAILRGICKGIVLGISTPDRGIGILDRISRYMSRSGLGRLSVSHMDIED